MTLGHGRFFDISLELRNFDICIFPGSSLQRYDVQEDNLHTEDHLHFNLCFLKGGKEHRSFNDA